MTTNAGASPLALCLIATCCVSVQASSDENRVLSVCNVLKNIERLNGRIIRVRGLIGWTQRHGISPLVQEGLDPYVQSCPDVGRQKQDWTPALAVDSPETLEPTDGTVKFRSERPTLDDLVRTAMGHAPTTHTVVATLIGEIKTRKRLSIQRRKDGDIIGNGFGQAGACPGLLVVKTVVAVEDPKTHHPIRIEIVDAVRSR